MLLCPDDSCPARHADTANFARKETFGPVVSVLPFDTLEEAIALNNGTEFGLIASLWTRDERLAHQLAARLKVGSVAINAHMEATGLPSTPWGGIQRPAATAACTARRVCWR